MDSADFRRHAHELVDWMADYLDHVGERPVRAQVEPRDVISRLPLHPPEAPEPFDRIFGDFENIILPGMTHWQHPSFFGYFPANSSEPSILAEMLTATLGAQCMSWVTSPAATELEERMMEWLRDMCGLPAHWSGVIQDTASTATLCAILTAREVRTGFGINTTGFPPGRNFTVYCSTETHSSVEKAVRIAGIGSNHLRKIVVDDAFALNPDALERAIEDDIRAGFIPLCVVAAIGTTGSTAIDPLRHIGDICARHGIWLHVDAAFAGSALILPECRHIVDGIEMADSYVFNPHKWLFTNFDCTAYFVRDVAALVRTFEILPEYLKTAGADQVNNYRDWGVQLGRRFRALKLWFVIRHYGVEGLRQKVRDHLTLAREFAASISASTDFELLAPVPLNLVCFRYHPPGIDDRDELDRLNAGLLDRLNAGGTMFLTHTRLHGAYTLRMVIGQTHVTRAHVEAAWNMIRATATSPGTTP